MRAAQESLHIGRTALCAPRCGHRSGKFKKVCADADATMATKARNRRLEPAYKQHTAVDDQCGVIVDVEVATGEQNEGMAVEERLDAIAETTGSAIATATMDAGYAYAKVFRALEDRGIEAIGPAKAEPRPGKVIPTRRFKFDALHNLARCPRGKILRPKGKLQKGSFQHFQARGKDCRACPLRERCVSPSLPRPRRRVQRRSSFIAEGAAQAARMGSKGTRSLSASSLAGRGRAWQSKTWHGLARAVRRVHPGLPDRCGH